MKDQSIKRLGIIISIVLMPLVLLAQRNCAITSLEEGGISVNDLQVQNSFHFSESSEAKMVELKRLVPGLYDCENKAELISLVKRELRPNVTLVESSVGSSLFGGDYSRLHVKLSPWIQTWSTENSNNCYAMSLIPSSLNAFFYQYFNPGYKPNEVNDGMIVLGLDHLLEYARKSKTGLGLAVHAIFYHELAHIIQYQSTFPFHSDLTGKKTHKYAELHADFISGWLMTHMLCSPTSGFKVSHEGLQELKDAFSDLGDDFTNDENHHGTSLERQTAFLAGFYCQYTNLDDANKAGLSYVSGIMIND